MTLAEAMLHAVAPAAAGVLVALALVFFARGEIPRDAPPDARARLLVIAAIPLTGLILALVGALQAQALPLSEVRTPLLALGAAAFLQAGAQGLLAPRAARAVAKPEAFGGALVLMVLPEALTVGALLWVLMTTSA